MTNTLSIIVPFFNNEDHIEQCIASLLNQTDKNFNLILVNDGSTDTSEKRLFMQIDNDNINVKYIKFNTNQGHSHARNEAIAHVKTTHFLFVDADDFLAPYTVEIYLKYLKNCDTLIAPITDFILNIPTAYTDDTLQVNYKKTRENESNILAQYAIVNIIFNTRIVLQKKLKFNESLNVYSDWSFIIDYLKYAKTYVDIKGIPFYICGEIYDPLNTNKLREQSFEYLFKDFVKASHDALARIEDPVLKQYVLKSILKAIKLWFEPSDPDIEKKYRIGHKSLTKLIPLLMPAIQRETKFLFKVELLLLQHTNYRLALSFNKWRLRTRYLKNILLNKPNKNLSKYLLFNKKKDVDNEMIVFESFSGKNYNDSPKYIYEYMQHKYPNLKYYWIYDTQNKVNFPQELNLIAKNSKSYFDIYRKAHVWVTNARIPVHINKKNNQLYIQTWHGTPLKKLANDMKVVRMPNTTTASYKKSFYNATRRWDYLISPNAYSTAIFQSAFWMQRENILEIGYPRNDILVNHAQNQPYINEIKANLNIPLDKKVVLYAPTWRDDEYNEAGNYQQTVQLDLTKLRANISDQYIILLRMHYLIANKLDLSDYEDFIVDVSDYSDISELYLISDGLITDYSSVMFDYGVLKRPQFFYAYDIEKYKEKLRGFYIDYFHELPGPIFTNTDEVIEGLNHFAYYAQQYSDKINSFHNKFCSIENGHVSQYIGDLIYNNIHNPKN
ncbi:bifunctional glycosyltransferase/CDP-glycerol:glycerophosphate glycerophosphotransferase [Staphylococcus cohnii species complex 1663]|uniref:bifunctional glycosyltransferase/CDP-glycerol:glycerophosphate glycerophosphotransferase n=1 Tax=Staphylococcus cohnii species complex 1663 TaxID=3239421 RepID=UPI0034D60C29